MVQVLLLRNFHRFLGANFPLCFLSHSVCNVVKKIMKILFDNENEFSCNSSFFRSANKSFIGFCTSVLILDLF